MEIERGIVMSKIRNEDWIAYLEMARLAMSCIPDDVVDSMDLSDKEFLRLRDQLRSYMDDDGTQRVC